MNYKNIYESIREYIIKSLVQIIDNKEKLNDFAIEIPKNKDHGHLSTNAAMILASSLKKSPRDIAILIKNCLEKMEDFESVEIAGPGFINLTLKTHIWHKVLAEILIAKEDYGKHHINEKINIEFVSANPTGPMHIGHARPAVYGDVLSSVMKYLGYDVTKEYYVNDAGSQINTLVQSAYLRYLEVFGHNITIPSGYYPGEYLKDLAEEIKSEFANKFLGNAAEFSNLHADARNQFTDIVLSKLINSIRKDLSDLKIHHDVFFSEKSLHTKQYVDSAIKQLQEDGLIYKGALTAPKGEEDPEWENREQELFRSTSFGDDQDRSITKSDGSWTYFAGDIGYAKSKIDRGFKNNIIILGADHSGYVKRLTAVYKAISKNIASADVVLCQMVNFMQNGEPVKMSKRSGSFTTVADVIREVGADILRFMMITRKNDTILDFDLDVVKSLSKENPIFYVQYARVRAISIINNAKNNFGEIYKSFTEGDYDLNHLQLSNEIHLIRDLSLMPRVILLSAQNRELHKISYYLQNIAASFHALWNLGKESEEYRFITENAEVSCARLALLAAIINVITILLQLIGVKPLEKM